VLQELESLTGVGEELGRPVREGEQTDAVLVEVDQHGDGAVDLTEQ
jgi:hypothetical protein